MLREEAGCARGSASMCGSSPLHGWIPLAECYPPSALGALRRDAARPAVASQVTPLRSTPGRRSPPHAFRDRERGQASWTWRAPHLRQKRAAAGSWSPHSLHLMALGVVRWGSSGRLRTR